MLGVKRVVRRFGSLFLSGAFASYRLMWSFFYNMPLVERVKSSYRGIIEGEKGFRAGSLE